MSRVTGKQVSKRIVRVFLGTDMQMFMVWYVMANVTLYSAIVTKSLMC